MQRGKEVLHPLKAALSQLISFSKNTLPVRCWDRKNTTPRFKTPLKFCWINLYLKKNPKPKARKFKISQCLRSSEPSGTTRNEEPHSLFPGKPAERAPEVTAAAPRCPQQQHSAHVSPQTGPGAREKPLFQNLLPERREPPARARGKPSVAPPATTLPGETRRESLYLRTSAVRKGFFIAHR